MHVLSATFVAVGKEGHRREYVGIGAAACNLREPLPPNTARARNSPMDECCEFSAPRRCSYNEQVQKRLKESAETTQGAAPNALVHRFELESLMQYDEHRKTCTTTLTTLQGMASDVLMMHEWVQGAYPTTPRQCPT